ncbi:MAG: hypothetical protein AAGI44_07535 [Pseudomonadota bacterium]
MKASVQRAANLMAIAVFSLLPQASIAQIQHFCAGKESGLYTCHFDIPTTML